MKFYYSVFIRYGKPCRGPSAAFFPLFSFLLPILQSNFHFPTLSRIFFYANFLNVKNTLSDLLLLQMLIKPQEGGNEEEICHDPRHRVAEADTRPRQGWYQPETHTASRYHFHHATQHREVAVTQALDAVAQEDRKSTRLNSSH